MRLLDRYVGRIVAGAFAVTLIFFYGVMVLLNLLYNLPDYVDRAAKQGLGGFELALHLGIYYAKLLPAFVTGVAPLTTVIACMFAVARLQQANEVVPMLFVGRSIQRILRPMLLCGVVAGLAMAASWQWIVPHIGASLAMEDSFLHDGSAVMKNLVHETRGETNQYLSVGEFVPASETMRRVNMLVEGVLDAETTLVTARQATWDKPRGDWHLEKGKAERRYGTEPQEWLERPDLTPARLVQIGRDTIDPEMLSYSDLITLLEARPNRADVRLALHRHITYPLANLLLLLLALPFAVFYERGSRIERVLLAIGLCGAYMLMDLICQRLGQRGLLHPVVAAWSPTIVFGALGIVLFGGTKT